MKTKRTPENIRKKKYVGKNLYTDTFQKTNSHNRGPGQRSDSMLAGSFCVQSIKLTDAHEFQLKSQFSPLIDHLSTDKQYF